MVGGSVICAESGDVLRPRWHIRLGAFEVKTPPCAVLVITNSILPSGELLSKSQASSKNRSASGRRSCTLRYLSMIFARSGRPIDERWRPSGQRRFRAAALQAFALRRPRGFTRHPNTRFPPCRMRLKIPASTTRLR